MISPIDNETTLYFEYRGMAQHLIGHWNIASYINLTTLEDVFTKCTRIAEKTIRHCNGNPIFKDYSLCQVGRQELEYKISEINTKRNTLQDLTGYEQIVNISTSTIQKNDPFHQNLFRSKRGLFDAIGWGLKGAFGTLDAYDGQYYDEAISLMETNEHNLAELVSNQSSVVQATISNINRTLTSMRIHEETFENNLRDFKNYTDNIENQVYSLELRDKINSHFVTLSMVLTDLSDELSILIDAVLLSKVHIIHPAIISPEQLVNELQKTLPTMPPSTEYPVELIPASAANLLQLCSIRMGYKNHRLIAHIQVPLIDDTRYNIFRLIPLPTKIQEHYTYIVPTSEYIAISDDKTRYINMPSTKGCIEVIKNKNFICALDNPISSNFHDSCELQQFVQKSDVNTHCNVKIINYTSGVWHKLEKSNSWLFVLPQPERMTISCSNSKSSDYILPQKGILHLPPNCRGTSASVRILSSYMGYSGFNSLHLNFSLISAVNDNFPDGLPQINLTLVKPITLDQEQLNKYSKSLKDIAFNADHVLLKHETSKQFSTFSIILFMVLGTILLYFAIALAIWGRQKYLSCTRPPVPPEEDYPLNNIIA